MVGKLAGESHPNTGELSLARAMTMPYTRRFAFNILGRVTGAVEIVKPVGAEHHVGFPRLGLGEAHDACG